MTARRLCVIGAALALAVALHAGGAPAVWAADSSAAPAASPQGNAAPNPLAGGQGFLPDPTVWAQNVFNQVLVSVAQSLTTALSGVVNDVLNSSLNFISQTPPIGSYDSPTVVGLWTVVRNIANAALLVVALWSGFNLMVKEQIGAPYHGVTELFPRLALTALLVNTSLAWARLVIDLNNALCGAVGQTVLPAWQNITGLSQALANVMAALVYVIAALLLLIQMLMRLALVNILLVSAPLALLCWAIPQAQGWARLWSSTFTGTVFVQFVQVLALKLGAALITDTTPMMVGDVILTYIVGVAIVAVTLKLPALLRGHLGSGLGFGRYVAFREGARLIESRAGGSAAASGTAATAAKVAAA